MATSKLLRLDVNIFLRNGITIALVELFAALAGTYYLYKVTNDKMAKKLVIFLWITFFVELIGSYAPIAYFSEYKIFGFVEGTKFEANYWLYNCYLIFSFYFYTYYFNSFLRDQKWKMIIKTLSLIYVLSAVGYLIFTDVFFNSFSMFTTIVGTLLLFFTIILVFFHVLRSDLLLKLRKWLPLYVAIGVLVFNSFITPIDIFSSYFERENSVFVSYRADIDLIANLFLYLTLTLGFIVCSKKK